MAASPWVVRFASYAPQGRRVLDLAAGSGRHSRLFLEKGFDVLAVDRDTSGLRDLEGNRRLEAVELDLEDGRDFPFRGQRFGAVVVTNYLYRPILEDIVLAVGPGGILIYETFAKGNEQFGSPSNPDFLLDRGELLEAVRGKLRVLAYEDMFVEIPRPSVVQRVAALNERS